MIVITGKRYDGVVITQESYLMIVITGECYNILARVKVKFHRRVRRCDTIVITAECCGVIFFTGLANVTVLPWKLEKVQDSDHEKVWRCYEYRGRDFLRDLDSRETPIEDMSKGLARGH